MAPRALALIALLAASALLPSAAAHHPGSNLGLAGLAPGEDQLVHNVYRVEARFADWEARFPDLVERFTIGESVLGHPLLGVVVTDESVAYDAANLSTGHKLRVYLDGGHHGNEYLGVELVMYYLEDVLTRADAGDADALALLRDTEIHAVPIVNTDGNLLDTRKNARQVDPNRNYDYQWGGPGSGDSMVDFNYRGPEAFSEPETRANSEYGLAVSPDLWITMHTGIAEFYWPWGWTHDKTPDDAFFTSLEEPFEAATNGRVDAMQAAELYEAAGATDDWGYAVAGTPTFTYEVHEDQFVPVYGEPIAEVIADQLAGLDFMVRNTERLGAWVEPVQDGDQWFLENRGWGVARNVSVTSGGESALVAEIAPGARVASPIALGADAEVTYPVLLIESSRVRTHSVMPDVALDGAGGVAGLAVPGPGAAALVGALGGVAVALAFRIRRAD